MRKSMKKILALSLALILAFCSASVAFAADEPVTPVIVISGMSAYPLYNEEGVSVFPMTTEKLVTDIVKAAPSLAGSIAMDDWGLFAKYGMEPIHDLFDEIKCDENGDSVNNITARTFPESAAHYYNTFKNSVTTQSGMVKGLSEEIGWDNTYFFHYDWRMNPMKLADDLDVMVHKAMEECGTDKVSFFAMSFGGMIATSYICKYGTEHLKNVVYGSTAFNGVEIVGRLFSGDPKITLEDALVYFATFAQDISLVSNFLGITAGVFDSYAKPQQDAFDNYIVNMIKVLKEPVYSEIFMDTYAHFQGMWCLMPDAFYEDAKDFISSTTTLSERFISEVDEYMYEVQAKNEEIINDAINDGVNVYIIGAYGYSGIPITEGAVNRTDTLIDTYLMTGDCAVAPMGKTLDDIDYSKDGACTKHNHISTDNVVDASVGFLPEKTWVIKNMNHVEFNNTNQSGKLGIWVVTSKEPVDVHTDARYPQFVELDRRGGAFISLTDGVSIPENEENELSKLTLFVNFIEKILQFIFKYLGIGLVK